MLPEAAGLETMPYPTMFEFPMWSLIGLSILQTASVFCLIVLGLRLIGRRIFSERDPQDIVIMVLVAEACGPGLVNPETGYWGTFFSVITILFLGASLERVEFLRHLLTEKPVLVYKDGHLDKEVMKKHMIDESDLDEVARGKGLPSYRDFESMTLEGDGNISGIYKREEPSSISFVGTAQTSRTQGELK